MIVPHQEGFQNLVSPMGTALTETQMRLLKRFTRRFVMALDPDTAGQKATMRGLEVARDALDHEGDPVFNARGLLQYESRLKADLRVSTLPDELDPDEIVLRNPEDWSTIIEKARPIIYHVLDTLTENQDIDDPKVKSAIVSQVLPLVKDIADPVERDAYRQHIARTLKIDERALMETSVSRAKPRRTKRSVNEQPAISPPVPIKANDEQDSINRIEKEIIAFLSIAPEQKFTIDQFLRANNLSNLSLDDFIHSENKEIARVVFASLTQDEQEPAEYVVSHIDLSDLPTEFNHPPLPPEKEKQGNEEVRKFEETTRLILQARLISVNQELKEIRFLNESQAETEDQPVWNENMQKRIMDLIKMRGLLDRAFAKPNRL